MQAREAKTAYRSMTPIEQYLKSRNAEIALARSATPTLISRDAEVLVLGRKVSETAIKGKNGKGSARSASPRISQCLLGLAVYLILAGMFLQPIHA